MKNRYVLVIHYPLDSLKAVMLEVRKQPEFADLGLLALTPNVDQYDTDWEGAQIPCRILECDFKNADAIRDVLAPFQQEIVGVICRGEKYVQYLRRVIPYLPKNVAVASPASLAAATNKRLMRAAFSGHYPEITPGFVHIHDASPAAIKTVEDALSYPVIVKPADLASSLLIQSCHDRQELSEALSKITAKVKEVYEREERDEPPQIIVEEYLEGDFYSIDAYVLEPDEIHFCPSVAYVPAKQLGTDDFFLYKRFVPTALSHKELQAANETTAKAIKSVGLRYSTVHVELVRTAHGWKVIEVGPRMGRFRDVMYAQAYGIDHSLNDVRLHLKQPPHIPGRLLRHCAAYSIYPEQEGILEEITNLQAVEENPLVVYLRVLARPGDMCHHAKHGGHALAEIIVASQDEAAFNKTIRFIEQNVKAVIKS